MNKNNQISIAILSMVALLTILLAMLAMKVSREKYSLGDLNDWARDVSPKTELNRWCQNRDNQGGDLGEGQHCVADCKTFHNRPNWFPGGKIKKVGGKLMWEQAPGYWVDFSPNMSKARYCQYIQR